MVSKFSIKIWALYFFIVVLDFIFFKFSAFSLDINSIIQLHGKIFVQVVLLFASFLIYNKNARKSLKVIEPIFIGLLFITPITVLTYFSIDFNFPLVDNYLSHIDSDVGFRWHTYIKYVDSSYFISKLLWLCYISFSYQLLLIPIILGFANQHERSYQFIFCFGLVSVIASLISVFTPAYGTYTTYALDVNTLRNIDTSFVFGFIEPFDAVRGSGSYTLSAEEFVGILTFPSVHAGVAGLCMWVFWGQRKLFLPFLVLNIGMACSAISHANHYFIDVIAGLAVAALSIFMSSYFFRDKQKIAEKRPLPLVVNPI